MTINPPRGPLHGVRVLDLTRVLAGPYATMLLWELGAEVLKVEHPGDGDDTRAFPPFQHGESVYFASINRGKSSIALNLKDAADRAVFDRLLAESDVLIENFRPGAMEKLGYGWEAVHRAHPRLTYCAISGFGHTGPYRDRPAYDILVQALGGMMSINGPEGGPPTRVGASIADLGAGVFAALGIAAALVEAKAGGQGRFIDIAMFDVQSALLENAMARFLAKGEVAGPLGSRHPSITPFDAFRAADGWLVIGCANDHLFGTLASALGAPGLAADARFATVAARTEHHLALKAAIEAALAGATVEAWIARFLAAGVPAAPIRSVDQVAADPQLAARNMIVQADDPDSGPLRMTGNPVKISGYAPDPLTRPPAPNLDQDGPAIRARLGPDQTAS